MVGSIAMMSSSGARGDPVAASSDGAFENRLGLALDAQIDLGLCCSATWLAHDIVPHEKEMNVYFHPGTS
jgi:hypothetical protein